MELILLIFTILFLGILDASISSVIAMVVISTLCVLISTLTFKNNHQIASVKTIIKIIIVYYICSFIISQAFFGGNNFLLLDPVSYLERYSSTKVFDSGYFQDELQYGYFLFADNNPLFNTIMTYFSYVGNTLLGGGSVFYFTLLHTFWGLLSAVVLFSILIKRFDYSIARKSLLSFVFLSPFLFYSCLCVRDIAIAFFYLLGYRVLLEDFSLKRLLLLFLIGVILVGFRLYSGLFFFIFPALYVYLSAENSKYKTVLTIFFIALAVALFIGLSYLGLITRSMEELATSSDFSDEIASSSGLSSKLNSLPPGIKQISKLFYSQFSAIPPYASLLIAMSFPQAFMAILVFVFSIWWYFVFYSESLLLAFHRGYKKLTSMDKYLFIIAIAYLVLNTTQIDVRRLMAVYPMLYCIHLDLQSKYSVKTRNRVNEILLFVYSIVIIAYLFLKI